MATADNGSIRVLILEDSLTDAGLILRQLHSAGLKLDYRHVTNREDYLQELRQFSPSIIIADYSLPDYDGMSALRHAREMSPETPFILVSGAIGEERAVDILKSGATDFILKQNLPRLAEAVRRALAEAREKAERKKAEAALQAERRRLYNVLEALPAMVYLLTPDYHIAFANQAFRAKFGESKGRRCYELCYQHTAPCDFCQTYEVLKTGKPHHWEVNTMDGTTLAVYDFPFIDVDGASLILEMDLDVTEERKAEAKLRELNETLEKSVAERTRELSWREAEYKSVVENIPSVLMRYDRNLRVIYLSPASESITGIPVEQFLGKTNREVGMPEHLCNLWENAIKQVFRTGQKTSLEFDFPAAKETRTFYLELVPEFDAEGKVVHVLGVSIDITERKKMEEALRESEAKAQALIKYAPTGIYEIDYTGPRFLSVNDAMCTISGYNREELFALGPAALLDEESRQRFADRVRRELAGEKIDDTTEFRVKKKDGSYIYVTLNIAFSRDKPHTAFLISHDITVRKQAEEKIAEMAQKYAALFNHTSDGAGIHDLDGIILEVNDAYCRMSGYSPEEIVGQPISLFETQESPEQIARHIQRLIAGGGHDRFESKHRRKDGSVFDVDVTALYQDMEGGRIAIFVRDVSQRKQFEQTLQFERDKLISMLNSMEDGVSIMSEDYRIDYINPSMQAQFGPVEGRKCYEYYNGRSAVCPWCNNKEVLGGRTIKRDVTSSKTGRTYEITDAPLKNADGAISKLAVFHDITERKKIEQLKDDFIGMVSHELKTPLTVIMGALATAADPRLPAPLARELLDDAVVHTGILSNLVENLLELSRQQSGRLVIQAQPVNVAEIARYVVNNLKNKSGIHHLVDAVPEDLPPVLADPLRLDRIIYNLVDNAIKYSPNGGEVRVTARSNGDQVTIGVSDQGPGISADDQARLFQSFERLGVTVKGSIQGTGLGLRVCRILVEAHSGRIWVESAKGKGSTFLFTLPAAG